MQTANQQTLPKLLESSLCLVEMSAPWCPDCRRIEPILQKLQAQYPQVKFILLDFDENQALKDKLGVRRIPTLIFYKNGQEVLERLVEPDSILPIQTAIENLLAL